MKILAVINIFSLLFVCSCGNNLPKSMNQTPVKKITYLALGDSYTIGESISEYDSYPVILTHELKKKNIAISDPRILATTGWTTGNLKNAILKPENNLDQYDLVSLLIGVNNEYQGKSVNDYKTEFRELLMMSIELAYGNKNKVFVISIPDYGYTPFGTPNQADISARIDKFNIANKHISDSLGVKYFDITPISRKVIIDPQLVASDGLHFSGKMYRQWVEMIKNEVVQLIHHK
jgi:acyl-CoA thioesterase-1